MKKLLIFLLVIAVLALVTYAGYRFYLPVMIAETLMSDQPSAMVPSGMQEKVAKLKTKIDEEVKKLPVFMKQHKIGYEDLQTMIDRADPDELLDAYHEIASTRITSTNQVFDIGMKHVKIEGYDLEIFRNTFVHYLTVKDIDRAIKDIEQNKLLTTMGIPVAKETAKQILKSSKREIQEGLNKLNRTGKQ